MSATEQTPTALEALQPFARFAEAHEGRDGLGQVAPGGPQSDDYVWLRPGPDYPPIKTSDFRSALKALRIAATPPERPAHLMKRAGAVTADIGNILACDLHMKTVEAMARVIADAMTSEAELAVSRAAVNAHAETQARVEALEAGLTAIAGVAGNLSDETLMAPTGPRDAGYRGGMVVSCREIALTLLSPQPTKAE